jgi:hypothetical protein
MYQTDLFYPLILPNIQFYSLQVLYLTYNEIYNFIYFIIQFQTDAFLAPKFLLHSKCDDQILFIK